jgi:hypothetical protein
MTLTPLTIEVTDYELVALSRLPGSPRTAILSATGSTDEDVARALSRLAHVAEECWQARILERRKP